MLLRDASTTQDPRLDLIFDKDPRNRDYPVTALAPTTYERKDTLWLPGPVTDQGSEGACVGHGCTQASVAMGGVVLEGEETLDEYAARWYHVAQHGDQWPGCSKGTACELAPSTDATYGGTSVKSGGELGVHRGLWAEYRWAFGIDQVLETLTTVGRVIFGVPWHEGMYEAPGGVLDVTGRQVGAHCIGADAIFWSTEEVELQNSWGLKWGINGRARLSFTKLEGLLGNGGECMVPIKVA